jgi:N utilization substance protein B
VRHPRQQARSLAFQTLFELESRPGRSLDESLQDRVEALEEESGEQVQQAGVDYALRLVRGALAERASIDERIARAAPAFPIEQIAMTDRVALEIAIHEILSEPQVPLKVAINEAVELAKTYGGENSGRFVNGVLGTIAGDVEPSSRRSRGAPGSPAGE